MIDLIGIIVSVGLLCISEVLPFVDTKVPANGILHTVLSLIKKKPTTQEQTQEPRVQEVRITCKNKTTTIVIRSGHSF